MRFVVHHFSHYEYTLPITLGEHTLRLIPQGSAIKYLVHDLVIEPLPVVRSLRTDVHGNQVLAVAFAGTTQSFRIDSRFEALTEAFRADFNPGFLPIPWSNQDGPGVDPVVATYAQQLARDVGYQPLPFLDHLCGALFRNIDRQVRIEGHAQAALETLTTLRGACRDVTVLFMDCARAMGISARFVSGYQAAAETPDGQRYLHAWPEVYLPGLGWKGYDPTHGLEVSDGHVPLCAAPSQAETMPVEGGFSFVGETISSTLRFGVSISTLS